MIPYETNKDYRRLKELLDEGNKIIIFYYPDLNDKKYVECTLSAKIKIFDNKYAYDIGAFDIYYWHLEKQPFEYWCEKYNVEFIEPNVCVI